MSTLAAFDIGDLVVITRDGITKNTPVIIIQKLLKDTYEVETTQDPPQVIIVPEKDLISFDDYLEDMELFDIQDIREMFHDHMEDFEEFLNTVPSTDKKAVCECGAEKIGMPSHSHWCPKHE